ncbi:MAG: lysine exporter LysO family protein [Bacteroides sp.]
MVTIVLLALMIGGGAIGYFFRERKKLITGAGRFITYVVYVLLLVMGLSVGINDELFRDLPRVGLQSLVITIFALAGSIFFAWLFGKFLVRPIQEVKTIPNTENPLANATNNSSSALWKVLESLSFFGIFLVGVLLGQFIPSLKELLLKYGFIDQVIVAILFVLMLCVGLSIGGNDETFKALRGMGIKTLLLPLFTVVGTAIGVLFALPFFDDLLLKDVQVVGAGYAYYSLSSVIIKAEYSETIAAIAIVSNIIRELSTIMLAPLYVRLGGAYAPICCAGATSGDTVLPFILKATSPQYAVVSVYHGLVLTFFVPFAVPLALLL